MLHSEYFTDKELKLIRELHLKANKDARKVIKDRLTLSSDTCKLTK